MIGFCLGEAGSVLGASYCSPQISRIVGVKQFEWGVFPMETYLRKQYVKS